MINKIGEKIRELRLEQNLSLNELGSLVGVSKQSIHRYEHGDKSPSASTLLSISKKLGVPVSVFFESEPLDIKIDSIKFRQEEALGDVNDEIRSQIIRTCKEYLFNLFELKDLLGLDFNFNNPLEGVLIESRKDIEKAAKNLRKKWSLGYAPISDVTSLLESKGLSIIEIDGSTNFTGLYGKANDEIPFIVINKTFTDTTRKRFTLLHELGHVILEFAESIGERLMERLCDHFAGAVLLVDDTLRQELGKDRTTISLKELKALKEKYGASIKSILIRANVTNYVSESKYREWQKSYEEWYQLSSRSDFGKFQCRERPVIFDNLITRGIKEERITWSKAAQLKNTKVDILKEDLNELEFVVG